MFHHYHRGENGSPISGAWSLYVGERARTLLKGWYSVLPGRKGLVSYAELEFALGGEDNMAQVGVRLPLLGCCYVGIRVPRKLISAWIYQRREWTVRLGYVGSWVELLIGYDDSARDMHDYYRRARERGEDISWTRLATWPGIRLSLRPRLRDRLLGRSTRLSEDVLVKDASCVVAMPEGNYAATATMTREVRGRKRWKPGQRTSVSTWIEIPKGVPVPGKGENSWDCGDDAIYGSGAEGESIGAACAKVAGSAMRQRERYGSGLAWVPDKGWPEEISRAA